MQKRNKEKNDCYASRTGRVINTQQSLYEPWQCILT